MGRVPVLALWESCVLSARVYARLGASMPDIVVCMMGHRFGTQLLDVKSKFAPIHDHVAHVTSTFNGRGDNCFMDSGNNMPVLVAHVRTV